MLAILLAAGAAQAYDDAALRNAAECMSNSQYFWDGVRCYKLTAGCAEYSHGEAAFILRDKIEDSELQVHGCARCVYGYFGASCTSCAQLLTENTCESAVDGGEGGPKDGEGSKDAGATPQCVFRNSKCLQYIAHCAEYADRGCFVCENGFFGSQCEPCAAATAAECFFHKTCAVQDGRCLDYIQHCAQYSLAPQSAAARSSTVGSDSKDGAKEKPESTAGGTQGTGDDAGAADFQQSVATADQNAQQQCAYCQSDYELASDALSCVLSTELASGQTCAENQWLDNTVSSVKCLYCGYTSMDACARDEHCHWANNECKKCGAGLEYDVDLKKCLDCTTFAVDGNQNCSNQCLHVNQTKCINYPAYCLFSNDSQCSFNTAGTLTACEVGYFAKSNQCVRQTANCIQMASTQTCNRCNVGFHRYTINRFSYCKANREECAEFSTSDKCIHCKPGYAFVNTDTCIKCPIGCLRCIRDSTIFGDCLPDGCDEDFIFVPSRGTCTKRIAFCAEYNSAINKCATCEQGSRIVNSLVSGFRYCVPCTDHCTSCNDSGCNKCDSGYDSVDGKCFLPCQTGFYRNGTEKCTSCGVTALSCTCLNGNLKITSCKAGFYLTNNTCQRCASACAACTDGSACTKCAAGYSSGVSVSADDGASALEPLQTFTCHKCTGCVTCDASGCIYQSEADQTCQDGWEYKTAQPNAQSETSGCYEKCSDAQSFYYDALNRCRSCPASLIGCTKCKSATECQQGGCKEGYYYKAGNCIGLSVLQTVGAYMRVVDFGQVLAIAGGVVCGLAAGTALGVICVRQKRQKDVVE